MLTTVVRSRLVSASRLKNVRQAHFTYFEDKVTEKNGTILEDYI